MEFMQRPLRGNVQMMSARWNAPALQGTNKQKGERV
jgi:hypothetical protein